MIPLYKIYIKKGIEQGIADIFKSGQLANGKHVKEFEKKLQNYIGNKHILAVNSHHSALVLALRVAGIGLGDEVIASPMACLSTNSPIKTCGAKIVWADINPKTGNIAPSSIPEKVTKRTKAILHFHWAGYPGEIEAVNSIARKFNLKVIEDASEGFGAQYKNKKLGNNGTDFVCFSFRTVRLLSTVEGGAVAFRNKSDWELALKLNDFGINRKTFRDGLGEINPKSDVPLAGYNFLMDELAGFTGCSHIAVVPLLLKKSRANANYFKQYVKNKSVQVLYWTEHKAPSFWVFTLLAEQSDKLLRHIRARGIYCSRVHQRNDFYSCFGKRVLPLPGVEEFSKKAISVPCGWWLKKKEREAIVKAINDFK